MSAHRRMFNTASPVAAGEVKLTADDLVEALLRLAPARRLALLDSGRSRNTHTTSSVQPARYLIAGFDPFEIIEERGTMLRTTRSRRKEARNVRRGEVLSILDERLREYRQPVTIPDRPHSRMSLLLPGACIATFSYDLVHQLERLHTPVPAQIADAPPEPDATLAFYDALVIHDYASATTYVTSAAGERRVTEVCAELRALAGEARHDIRRATSSIALNPPTSNTATSNFTRDAYLATVLRIKEHIRAGDIYQANLTQQITSSLLPDTEPADIFLRLRRAHPAAMSAFLHRQDDTVVSCSPERFLRIWHEGDARRIEAAPIKGTRPRGQSVEEDLQLRHELATSDKDRAENIMIVDLLRNDLGRLCRYGSVEVTELCRVEEHPTLFHLVSTVRGMLRDDVTAGDLLRGAFPCGSITGAPKIRAMEIINDIEPTPRGLSMGSIGYFSFCGRTDLNVAIRTMTIADRTARFNVGGGITFDSRPADEYDESLTKARALLTALNSELNP